MTLALSIRRLMRVAVQKPLLSRFRNGPRRGGRSRRGRALPIPRRPRDCPTAGFRARREILTEQPSGDASRDDFVAELGQVNLVEERLAWGDPSQGRQVVDGGDSLLLCESQDRGLGFRRRGGRLLELKLEWEHDQRERGSELLRGRCELRDLA